MLSSWTSVKFCHSATDQGKTRKGGFHVKLSFVFKPTQKETITICRR